MKFKAKSGAASGSYEPFVVGEQEIVLTGLTLQHVTPGDQIVLSIDVNWVKPIHWDMGEMELCLRLGQPDGQVVYWTLESCFEKSRTRESFTWTAENGEARFYLTVKSVDSRAILSGDYWLEGTVYAPS
ncbi:hypothetical protein FHS19_006451 [Paenibacillus rhizosphaerae]|uniref:Uncharacterized protein n=1 Tax=Paenibacillus rhizosphaerae TaxID=297318 RepID=A0A839U238_9BACL|nr:hypothetical protein [Paenibacillus rhizosphaerae]MBB3131728.1 hypothetical protein [Paenibacillus rhizosphaerae]